MSDKAQEFKHPSYGMVAFSRYMGGHSRLFGSAVRADGGISLRITRGVRYHKLHQDWYHGEANDLIEVNMTEAQFATLITSFNMNSGVPCTIRHFNGKLVPEATEDPSEAELIHHDIKDHVKNFDKKLAGAKATLNEALNKTRLSQKDRREIDWAVEALLADVANNVPFLLSQFQESVDRAVSQAKNEVVAFAEQTLKAKGLEAINKSVPQIDVDK